MENIRIAKASPQKTKLLRALGMRKGFSSLPHSTGRFGVDDYAASNYLISLENLRKVAYEVQARKAYMLRELERQNRTLY